jgi:hypothetical protein
VLLAERPELATGKSPAPADKNVCATWFLGSGAGNVCIRI